MPNRSGNRYPTERQRYRAAGIRKAQREALRNRDNPLRGGGQIRAHRNIIYFKASLTGDESSDIKNYHTMHPQFPHETTVDQWFTESQFESYRELGYHEVMTSMLGEAAVTLPTGSSDACECRVRRAIEN